MSRDPQDDSRRFSRRTLLTRAAALGAGAVVSAGALASQTRPGATPVAEPAGPAVPPRREPLETLTAAEAATLEAIVARLIPADENGPGAAEGRAAHYKDNERQVAAFIQERMSEWFMAAGAVAVERAPIGTMGPTTHAYGGTRMGDNPETNVANCWGISHEAPNLGILGASVMGTSGARNPTLTVQALAWRTADYLVRNWRTVAQ